MGDCERLFKSSREGERLRVFVQRCGHVGICASVCVCVLACVHVDINAWPITYLQKATVTCIILAVSHSTFIPKAKTFFQRLKTKICNGFLSVPKCKGIPASGMPPEYAKTYQKIENFPGGKDAFSKANKTA